MQYFDYWKFLAGLGIFLLGMTLVEGSLSGLAGRSFKKSLRRYTSHPLGAILTGIVTTTVLQSSSVVSLMVLAFVGAGIIELRNALGIILGANVGSTFTGWLVAYFGFSFDIEQFALPLVALGGLSMAFFEKKEKLLEAGRLLAGLGFLFLGLDYMKVSIEELALQFDISPFVGQSPYLLFVVGFLLTAVIQSSSAATAITLSALSAQMISLEAAAAMVVGNDLGTTIKVLFGGIRGIPAKKRVALSHFLFNIVTDLLALALLFPLLRLTTQVWGFSDPLLTLVAFHTSFNVLGVLLFLPLLGVFARFLERRFQQDEKMVAKFIPQVPPEVPEAALEALRKEVRHLVERVFLLNASFLEIKLAPLYAAGLPEHSATASPLEQYESLKALEGEITEFYLKTALKTVEREDAAGMTQLNDAIRHAMSAAKGVKDVWHNFKDFDKSVNDEELHLAGLLKEGQAAFYQALIQVFKKAKIVSPFELLSDLKHQSKRNFNHFFEQAYRLVEAKRFTDIEISTLFNVNREIHGSNKALVLAVKDLLLEAGAAKEFEAVPEES